MSEHTPLTEAERERTFTAAEVIEIANETSDSLGNLYRLDFIARIQYEAAARTSTATADTGLRERVEAKMRDCLRLSGTAMDPDVREWTLAFGKDLKAILDATAAPTTDTGARDE